MCLQLAQLVDANAISARCVKSTARARPAAIAKPTPSVTAFGCDAIAFRIFSLEVFLIEYCKEYFVHIASSALKLIIEVKV